MEEERFNDIFGILFFVVAALIFLSLITYNPADLNYFVSTPNKHMTNFVGVIGAYLGGALFFAIGYASFAIPILIVFWATSKILKYKSQKLIFRLIGSVIALCSISGLFSMLRSGSEVENFKVGGMVGFTISNFMLRYFGAIGAFIIIGVLLTLSLLLATDFLIIPFTKYLLRAISALTGRIKAPQRLKEPVFKFTKKEKPQTIETTKKIELPGGLRIKPAPKMEPKAEQKIEQPKLASKELPPEKPREIIKEKIVQRDASEEMKVVKPTPVPKPECKLPSIDLLESPPPIEERKIMDDVKVNSDILEGTLRDFGIETKVVQVNQGPVITRYELQPAPGVKVHKITALSDDIALAMKAQSIRIVAPVPGKGTVGVEVPNSESTVVYLKEVLESPEFKESKSKLKLALGKSISGHAVVAELGDMPHLLIAGTTGSGKTVCVNCLIMSLIFTATPDELKFLMIDPKMVELSIYNGLPHLLCPVVTDPKKVSSALSWLVNEMESRYKIFAEAGARNIDIYNDKVRNGTIKEPHALIPYIIVMIDELADLMLVAQTDIESAITRLAQLSRAVGIHIVLATQRPSVDVITGVIKANFPARISFKVATKVDSRTVLDINGADKLLGRGDLLFLQPGTEKPIRAQGTLVTDSEIEKAVNFMKSQRGADYNEEILSAQKKQSFKTFERDEVYEEAVKMVLQTKQASVSMLQRRLGLGYTRAARLIDMMEEEGIVGSYQGSKPRVILIENLDEIRKEG